MTTEIQRLVEELADELGRAVTIDDSDWHLEAHSAVDDDPDPVRVRAILDRDAPPAAKEWARELRLASASGATRVPANPKIESSPRLVVPIRHEGTLLGFLTLLDPAEDLKPAEIAITEQAAERAAEFLYRDRLAESAARGREQRLLRDLLSEDARLRSLAASTLREEMVLMPGMSNALVVVQAAHCHGSSSEKQRALEGALERLRRKVGAGTAIGFVRSDHAIVLAVADGPRQLGSIGRELLGDLSAGLEGSAPSVGISAPLDDPTAAPSGLRQALDAASIAAWMPSFRHLAFWEELGVSAMLMRFEEGSPLDRRFEQLRRADRDGTLTHTLEVYLDHGGDAKLTAEELSLHRSGLYYRLSRISELAAVDLADGEARLAMHLSIKLDQIRASKSL
jgi:hypothetical protein